MPSRSRIAPRIDLSRHLGEKRLTHAPSRAGPRLSEFITTLHGLGDAVALVALIVLGWAAFFFVGPLLCAGLVLMRAADVTIPADAALLFYGTAAAWSVALILSLVARAVRVAWQSLRASTAAEAGRRGARAGHDMREGRPVGGERFATAGGEAPRPSPFAFSFRDPWVAWASEEAKRVKRERTEQLRAQRTHGGGPSSGTRNGAGGSTHGTPPPRPAPPRAPEPDPHAVLGVPRGASADSIRKAYRELVKKHHPDRVTDRSAAVRKAAHQKILEIRKAYDALR